MSNVSREELKRELKANRFEPLYLLFGAETYLRDAAARAITEMALRGASLREFNDSTFSVDVVDVQQALAAAFQLPMMAERRVVRLTNFAKLREADEDALLRYVARPVATTILILVAEDLDKRRKLTKALLENCAAVEFAPLKDAELFAWCKSRLKELKAEADERTIHQVVALVGSDIRKLSIEIEKLAIAALPSGRIPIELVDALTNRTRELSNFELTDHLIARNRKRALGTLARLLDDGVEPLMLIGLMASNFHRLAVVKEMMAGGAPKEEVFRVSGLPYSKREEFLSTARRSSSADLARAINRIAAADLAIKTSQATPRLQLEMLVCELAA